MIARLSVGCMTMSVIRSRKRTSNDASVDEVIFAKGATQDTGAHTKGGEFIGNTPARSSPPSHRPIFTGDGNLLLAQ
jgi:hypothetical protein